MYSVSTKWLFFMCALWPHRSSHHYAISFCSISLSLSFYQPLCPCVRGQTIFASKYVFKYPAHPKFGPTLNAHTHTPPLRRFHSIYSTNEFRVRNVLLMQITGEPKAKKKSRSLDIAQGSVTANIAYSRRSPHRRQFCISAMPKKG